MPTLDEREIKLLELIRDATAARLIRWKPTKRNPDLYTAANTPLRHGGCYIQFKWPAYNDDPSDRDFVEVYPVGRFMIGTRGWVLAIEILAAAFPAWADHLERLSAADEDNIERLTTALAEAASKRRKSVTPGRNRKPRNAGRSA